MTQAPDAAPTPAPLLSLVITSPDPSAATDLRSRLAAGGAVEVVVATDPDAGLARATGEWVTFPDLRDEVTADYVGQLAAFLRSDAARQATIVATRPLRLRGAPRRPYNRHAMAHRFRDGALVATLAERPDLVQLHAETYAIRRAHLAGLAFDTRLTPAFRGPALLARALLRLPDPSVALAPDIVYRFGNRGGEQSEIEPPMASPEQYDEEFGHGHLGLLAEAEALGPVPAWLEAVVASDLATYLMLDRLSDSPTAGFDQATSDHFLDWASHILQHLTRETIETLPAITADVRAALLGIKGVLGVPDTIRVRRHHPAQRLSQLRFYHDDRPLEVRYLADGREVAPAFAKRRGVMFFGRAVVQESIAWLPTAGAGFAVRINGVVTPVEEPLPPVALPALPRRLPRGRGPRARVVRALRGGLRRVGVDDDRPLQWWASRWLAGRRFTDAWLLIDRDTEAHDNAEHLYRYLAGHRPDINAWFVLSRDSRDWDRLAREGFRLLEHGSSEHTIALHNCRHIVSSQVSDFITTPPNWPQQLPPRWQSHFLQHGITKDDISRWVNARPIDTLVCATAAEYEAFVADGSNYVFTAREAVLTGFPRNDELQRKAAATGPDERRLVVLMPTWRRDLVTHADASNRVELRPGFEQTPYARNWFGLANSAAVAAAAGEHGAEVLFMAHPNLAPLLDPSVFDPHVRVAGYSDTDVQEVLAQARVVVTDYSSTAFDAAFIDRPVLYFQFDRERFFGGGGYRPGYFDYERDGFGPVVTGLSAAEREVVAVVRSGGAPAEPYATRIAETFTLRDGRACERVVAAIADRGRPYGDWTGFASSPAGRR